jgi:membrane-bound lytic murein transglycosylase F
MDWRLVLAVIRQESRFRHDAVSYKGAYGLMQIMPVTQAELTDKIGVEEATTPRNNIRAGVFHLRSLYRYFDEAVGDDRVQLTLAAYNAGLGRIRDAQAIAKYLGHDPSSWRDVKDALPLLSKRYYTLHRQIWPEGKPRSGYFRNHRQTTIYVENIMQFYSDYKLALN